MTTVLDEIPLASGWTELPLRAIATKVSEPGYGHLQPLSVYLEAGVVPRSSREDNHNQLGENIEKYQRVLPNDLVFNKLRTWQGGFGISKDEGIVSPAYIIARPLPGAIDPRFLGYLLKSAPYLAELTRLSKWMPPSQFDISWESIRDLRLRIPPLEDQQRVAEYLDTRIITIDNLITRMRRELLYLDELDRGYVFDCLISQAAFNPKRGFQIMGADPSWRVVPLFYLCDEVKSKNVGSIETNLLSLSYGNVISKDIETTDGLLPESFENYNKVQPGDIVLRLTDLQNDQKSLRVGQVTEQGIITSAYTTLRPKKVNPSFLAYQMKAFDSAKFFYALGGGLRQSMKFDDLKNLSVLLPSEQEQIALVQKVSSSFSTSDLLRKKLKSQIDLAIELRIATITAAVTGTFDVTTGRSVA